MRGSDAEFPVLAMNAQSRFVIAYPQTDPFGPLGVATGSVATGRIRFDRVVQLGTRSDLSPLQPAISRDGHVALGWSVRRQLRPANRVAFGIRLGELAPGHNRSWRTRTVLAPTVHYDPSGDGSTTEAAFAGDRVLETWTTQRRSVSTLVLAQQTTVSGPLHARTLLTARRYTTIEPVGLGVDVAGSPVLAASLQPALQGPATAAASRSGRPTAVAFTTRSDGQLGAAQVLRRGCSAENLTVAGDGQAAVVMICQLTRDHSQIWVAERAPHQRFASARRVSPPGVDGVFPSVSIIPDGRVCAIWDRVVGSAKDYDADIVRTEVSCAAPNRPFSVSQWQTGRYPTQLNAPTLLTGPRGLTLARGDKNDRVVLQRLLPAGHLGPVIALSGPYASNQTVAVSASGHGLALWDAAINHKNRPVARSFTLP
jgi:hypothetical protein